jgi:hypothetical protein
VHNALAYPLDSPDFTGRQREKPIRNLRIKPSSFTYTKTNRFDAIIFKQQPLENGNFTCPKPLAVHPGRWILLRSHDPVLAQAAGAG